MPDRWDRIQDLYHRALERNDAERERFVAEACLGDDELRQEVESLLGYASEARRVMEPAAETPRIEKGRQKCQRMLLALAQICKGMLQRCGLYGHCNWARSGGGLLLALIFRF